MTPLVIPSYISDGRCQHHCAGFRINQGCWSRPAVRPHNGNGHYPDRSGAGMGYASLRQCVVDLERTGQLVRVGVEIDPHLEAAAIHRRVYAAGGPAVLFERVKGCAFPMVSNLFGTLARTRFLFRDALAAVENLVRLKTDPAAA